MATYLLPKARNLVTGQTVKVQDLDGSRMTTQQRALAQERANLLAQGLTDRTNEQWQGFVIEYTPSSR